MINDLKSFGEKATDQLQIKNDRIEMEIGNVSQKIRELEKNGKQQIDPANIGDVL